MRVVVVYSRVTQQQWRGSGRTVGLFCRRLSAVLVDELKSQLNAERKRSCQLKRTIETQLDSVERANVRLAFHEEERGTLHV